MQIPSACSPPGLLLLLHLQQRLQPPPVYQILSASLLAQLRRLPLSRLRLSTHLALWARRLPLLLLPQMVPIRLECWLHQVRGALRQRLLARR